MEEMRNSYKSLVRKPEGKRHRWEDNVRIQLREMGGKMWTGFMWLRIGTSDRLL